jgi:hypothetical protein
MFEADQPDSVLALANGIWLAVTFPIDPEMSAVMLGHLVEESPTGSETAAVAAAAAHYIAGLRGQGKAGEDLQMFTGHQLATVARYSSQVSSQEEFEAWMVGRALDRPEEFLPRLGQALDALVGDRWWVDRDALRARLPVN